MLCNVCQAIFRRPIDPADDFSLLGEHHSTIQNLRESASKDCQICSLVNSVIDTSTEPNTLGHTTYKLNDNEREDDSANIIITLCHGKQISKIVFWDLEPVQSKFTRLVLGTS